MMAVAAVLAAMLPGPAQPAAAATIVVTAPGGDWDNDDATSIDARQLSIDGRADVLGNLARMVPGLSLSDAQGNPWQPSLVYRGFVASPLQGTAQGLAVYLDGGRFNQPFGDTVNFDLLPEAAIARITIKDASPIYGLNALGGAIVVATQTGRSAPGVTMAVSGGDQGRREASFNAGGTRGDLSGFVALRATHDDGWRQRSPSTLYNGFADLGLESGSAGLHLKIVGADTDLTGNGSAPVELLAADRSAVFTSPDTTRNRYLRASLHPWVAVSETVRIEASLYAQRLRQRTLNGDAAEIQACPDTGLLCIEAGNDSVALQTDGGGTIADTLGGGYAVLNRSRTATDALGALAQVVDRRPFAAGENVLIFGFSHDRSHTEFQASTELGVLAADRNVSGIGPIISLADGAIAPVSLVARTRYTGLFVSETLPLLADVSVELGARWNDAQVLLDDRIGTALDGRHRFRRFNPGIEIDWRITPQLQLRGGYSESNRAPTPAELSCAGAAAPCSLTNFFVGDPPLRQVVSRSWEAGASGHIDGGWRVEWLFSAYRATNRDDIQLVASSILGRAYFQNLGSTRRQGIEASITATRAGWTLHGGYALTDATFRSTLVLGGGSNPAADANGHITVLPGNRLPGVPRHRGVFSADYAAGRYAFGGDITAQSGQFFAGDAANLQPGTRGYVLANLRGSIAIAGPLTLFASVSNLFEKRFASFGTFGDTAGVYLSEAPGASNPRSIGPGAPRRWTAGLRARF